MKADNHQCGTNRKAEEVMKDRSHLRNKDGCAYLMKLWRGVMRLKL